MKSLLLIVILSGACVFSKEVEGVNLDPQSVDEEILLIHDEMEDLHDLLRDDRTGPAIQIDGKEIIEAIDKLIKEIEDAKETNKEPKGKPLAERWKKLRSLAGLGNGNRAAPRKIDSGRLHEGDGFTGDRWAKLSKTSREEMIQNYNEEVPVRWRWKVAAYFLSINAVDKDRPAKNQSP